MFRSLLATLAIFAGSTTLVAQLPNTVSFTEYGTSCGPTLSGDFTPIGKGNGVRVQLTVTNLDDPKAMVVLFIGFTRFDPGLPLDDFGLIGCFLYNNVSFSQVHQAKNGSYTWDRSLGDWTGTAQVQFVELGTEFVARTSNGLEVVR